MFHKLTNNLYITRYHFKVFDTHFVHLLCLSPSSMMLTKAATPSVKSIKRITFGVPVVHWWNVILKIIIIFGVDSVEGVRDRHQDHHCSPRCSRASPHDLGGLVIHCPIIIVLFLFDLFDTKDFDKLNGSRVLVESVTILDSVIKVFAKQTLCLDVRGSVHAVGTPSVILESNTTHIIDLYR